MSDQEVLITHDEFVERYGKGELMVLVNANKAGDFVLSHMADRHNRPAHLFWTWLGIILWIAAVPLLFVNWIYAVGAILIGSLVASAARKSAQQFVLQDMLKDVDFWMYVLVHNGAKITDEIGNTYHSKEFHSLD